MLNRPWTHFFENLTVKTVLPAPNGTKTLPPSYGKVSAMTEALLREAGFGALAQRALKSAAPITIAYGDHSSAWKVGLVPVVQATPVTPLQGNPRTIVNAARRISKTCGNAFVIVHFPFFNMAFRSSHKANLEIKLLRERIQKTAPQRNQRTFRLSPA